MIYNISFSDIAPGIPFSSVKSGLGALESIPAAGTLQLIAFIGILEAGFAIRKDEIEAAQIKASGWYNYIFSRSKI